MKYNEESETIAEINVVPLVDIVLVILIIFMVSAPLFIKPSINVNLPQAASGKETKQSILNITLAADGRIDLNGALITIDELRVKAKSEVTLDADVQAIISADKKVSHGEVINLLDKLQLAGIKKFAINVLSAP